MTGADRKTAVQDELTRLADGERSAVAPLFDALWPVLLGFCLRALTVRAEAEDAAQEAFVKLCSQAVDFDRQRDALAWALSIASYEIRTRRQRGRRQREAGPVPVELPLEAPDAEAVLLQHEAERALVEALDQLSAADRLALEARDGPATGAQRKRRQRALERLRLLWRNLYEP